MIRWNIQALALNDSIYLPDSLISPVTWNLNEFRAKTLEFS
jgi:hypothetical protein